MKRYDAIDDGSICGRKGQNKGGEKKKKKLR
jgi:hypothetical protein